MRFDEYRRHDATALAGLIAKREVSAKEVLETAIARAEQVNPAINAIVHKQYERARKAVGRRAARRAARGRALSHQGPRHSCEKGEPATARQQPVQGFRRRPRQRLRGALQEGGPRHHGPQLDPGVRAQPHHRAAPATGPAAIPGTSSIRPAARRAAPRRP